MIGSCQPQALTVASNISPEVKPVRRLDTGYDVLMLRQTPVEVAYASLTEPSDVEIWNTPELIAILPARGATQGGVRIRTLGNKNMKMS